MGKCWILQSIVGEISGVKKVSIVMISRVPRASIRNLKSSIPKTILKEAVHSPSILNLTRLITLTQWLFETADLIIVKILIHLSSLHAWLRRFGRKIHMVCNQDSLFSHVNISLIKIKGVHDQLSARVNRTLRLAKLSSSLTSSRIKFSTKFDLCNKEWTRSSIRLLAHIENRSKKYHSQQYRERKKWWRLTFKEKWIS